MPPTANTINVDVSNNRGSLNVAKKNSGPGRPANPGGPNKPIGFRPKPRLRAALDKFLADQEVEVKDGAVLAAALEEFLTKRGYMAPGKPKAEAD